MKLSCNVTRDLLPLYHDGVCSDESRALVEEHVGGCEGCRGLLKELRGEIELSHESPDDQAVLEKIERNVKRGKKRAWLRGAAAVLAVVLVLFVGMNVWWYTQVYLFYARFGEGKPQPMAYEYDAETGEVVSSYPLDPSKFQWHTGDGTEYFCNVNLPDYLMTNGDVLLSSMFTWGEDGSRTSHKERMSIHASVYIGRELYTYSVHLTFIVHKDISGEELLEETRTEECVMLDADLNQVYLDHWDEDTRQRQDALLEQYRVQIMDVVEAAQEQWPFLTD